MKKVADYYNALAAQYDEHFNSGMREGEERLLLEKVIGTRVLDVGCGTGIHVWSLKEEGYEVFGLDISSALAGISRSRTSAPHVVSDAQRLPFKRGSFDCIISIFGAVNHVGSLQETVVEVEAALKPGGRVILTVANKWNLGWYLGLVRKGRFRQMLKSLERREGYIRRRVGGKKLTLWTRFYSAGELKGCLKRHFKVESCSGLNRSMSWAPACLSEYLAFVADKELH